MRQTTAFFVPREWIVRMSVRGAVATFVALLLSGCAPDPDYVIPLNPPTETPVTDPAAIKVVEGFVGYVGSLREYGYSCRQYSCRLDTHLNREQITGQSVSYEWPYEGDAVWVFCEGGPAKVWDERNWYGIIVPKEYRYNHGAIATRSEPISGGGIDGYKSYVHKIWITGGENKRAPDCDQL